MPEAKSLRCLFLDGDVNDDYRALLRQQMPWGEVRFERSRETQ